MKLQHLSVARNARRGGALLLTIIAVLVLSGMSAALLAMAGASKREHAASIEQMKALYVAQAGLSQTIASLTAGNPQNYGTQAAPVAFGGGAYWSTCVDDGEGTATLTAFGTAGRSARGIELVMTSDGGGAFLQAIFAGNESNDPLYSLELGGRGVQADRVDGDVYSGQNFKLKDNAKVDGEIQAYGTITGADGITGKKKPLPDIEGMNYPENNDFDVAALFASATYKSAPAGGMAWQLPEASPAHIFRKNPSDRATAINSTVKPDYFLEDPYEPVRSDPMENGSDAYRITLSGGGGEPGPDGNKKVYYIDGNLWLHNLKSNSLKLFTPESTGLQVTFVVRGNIYFEENFFLNNINKDGVLFLAMKDPAVPDSGNIYFGDQAYHAVRRSESFMYAENNFYDTKLSSTGSLKTTVIGMMGAGNQVKINRDLGTKHSALTVLWDERIEDGDLVLPGLPDEGTLNVEWEVASWREIGAP